MKATISQIRSLEGHIRSLESVNQALYALDHPHDDYVEAPYVEFEAYINGESVSFNSANEMFEASLPHTMRTLLEGLRLRISTHLEGMGLEIEDEPGPPPRVVKKKAKKRRAKKKARRIRHEDGL
jgi:hypothetical protein